MLRANLEVFSSTCSEGYIKTERKIDRYLSRSENKLVRIAFMCCRGSRPILIYFNGVYIRYSFYILSIRIPCDDTVSGVHSDEIRGEEVG